MASTTTHRDNWSEHQTTMFSSLHEKQKQGKYCDVLLKCSDSDQTFNAHGCVLSSASSVLDKLLQDAMDGKTKATPPPEMLVGKIFVLLPDDVTSPCMDSLLNYIYSGNVDLCQGKSSQKDNVQNIRKSKRISSSKSKNAEDDTSMDSSLLHAFLKASKCLGINTLTEHLESAVTLSEMKMTEVSSPEKPRRSSAGKLNSSKSNDDNSKAVANISQSAKQNKSKNDKKLLENRISSSKINKARSAKKKRLSSENEKIAPGTSVSSNKKPNKRSGNEKSIMKSNKKASSSGSFPGGKGNDAVDEQQMLGSVQSPEFSSKRSEIFKSRAAQKRHPSLHSCDEQAQQVDSFPVRAQNAEQLSCSICQKKFTNMSVMQLHMKKHKVGNAQDNTVMVQAVEQYVPQTPTSQQIQNNEEANDSNSAITIYTPSPTRPPRRASAKKFQDMMRNAFAIESPRYVSQETESVNEASIEPLMMGGTSVPEIIEESVVSDFNVISQQEVELDYQILEPATGTNVVTLEEVPAETPQELNSSAIVQEYIPAIQAVADGEYSGGIIEESEGQVLENVAAIIEENQITENGIPMDHNYGDESNDEVEHGKAKGNKRAKRKVKKQDEVVEITPESQACDICGKITANAKNMLNHMRSHNREELTCNVCNQKFKYQSALKRHQRWHTGEGQKCHVCKKVVYSQQEMTQHLTTHNVKKMRTQCTLCQKSFTSQYVMQLHMRTHSGDELFVCDLCGKKFPYKSSLKMHMRLHTGERPYICSVCGKCFVQKIHAKEHELQHAGIRRFQCQFCSKMFAHKCGLTRHVADIHYKSRPYVCDHCGKSFPRKTKLVEHTRTHTGERPYICNLCGARYKANRSLKEHKKKQHSVIVNDYEVGIWRNGPLPAEEKKPSPPKKKRKVKAVATFSFPISASTEEIDTMAEDAKKEQENIINNIAKEVDIVATDDTDQNQDQSTKDSQPDEQQFRYSIPISTDYQNGQITTVIEGTNYTATTLPPASTLTKISPGTVLPAYPPTMQGQPTYVVPLNVSASPTIPVIGEQVPIGGVSHVPAGMMVTCVLPQQMVAETANTRPIEITEGVGNTGHISRSASVPPMSTFRRPVTSASATSTEFQTAATPVSTLPGMHTFQPVQFQMNANAAQLPHMIAGFTPMRTAVSVMVPASTVISPVSQPMEVAAEEPEIVVHEQTTEWQPHYPSDDDS